MINDYLKIAWRSLIRHKATSLINLGGLAVGMAVALLIGLWITAELSYNRGFAHYDRIAQVMEQRTSNGIVYTNDAVSFPMGDALQRNFSEDFARVVMSSFPNDHILKIGDKVLSVHGRFMDQEAPRMLTLQMMAGTAEGLQDPHAILLSASTARALFGTASPVGQILQIDNTLPVQVSGVYRDLPGNSDFAHLGFIAPWSLYITSEPWIMRTAMEWDNNSFQLFVELAGNHSVEAVNHQISAIKESHVDHEAQKYQFKIFLHPMSDWHLRSHWDDQGLLSGGQITYVWLFGIIGLFVLLLACINFMNLSTARAQGRTKEVGIRKVIGCRYHQLVSRFYCESLLLVLLAWGIAVLLAWAALPYFNRIAAQQIRFPWSSPVFWLASAAFVAITSLLAGSYPAFYLSSFQPLKVLKGGPMTGQFSSWSRKALVVAQFTISLVLVIGTLVVYRQIQYSKDRPIGYNRNGLILIDMKSPDFYGKYDLLRNQLIGDHAIADMAESSSPVTSLFHTNKGFSWPGKDPGLDGFFGTVWVTHDYGKTVGWVLRQGRGFSRSFPGDSSGVVLNEAALHLMRLKDPLGKEIRWNEKPYHILGVVENMIMESPYDPVRPTLYFLDYDNVNWMLLKLNPAQGAATSLAKIKAAFHQYIPSAPFDYEFADEEFAAKFATESRIGTLAMVFTVLAIFISCLGLFGLVSYMAERRTREIGIRKVLGASVFSLWRLLSGEFAVLVMVALVVAAPVGYYLMTSWLARYAYHTRIAWWLFAIAGCGILVIALLTVSVQSIRAARANPVNSLKNE